MINLGNEGAGQAAITQRPIATNPLMWVAILLGFGILAISWMAVLVNDLNWPPPSLSEEDRFSAVWWFLFTESGPVEITQWLFLVGAIFLAVRLGALQPPGSAPERFWTLMGLAFVFLLLEDAGNIRHHLARLGHDLAPAFGGHPVATAALVERTCFVALAAIPCYALLRYGWHMLLARNSGRVWLVLGFGFYGIAALASALRYQNEFYIRVGGWLQDHLFRGGLTQVELSAGDLPDSFYVMDYFIEESLELAAVTCMVVAVVVARQRLAPRREG